MSKTEGKTASAVGEDILLSNPDGLRALIRAVMQEVLEAEMDEALGAEMGERGPARPCDRSGHHGRTPHKRVGKLVLRRPPGPRAARPSPCRVSTARRSGRRAGP